MAKPEDSAQTTLSVENFGPIAEATVELRPFTVLVGASNTGKSYLAILLYALQQFFGSWTSTSRRGVSPALLRHRPRGAHPVSAEQFQAAKTWLQALRASGRQGSVDVALPDEVAAFVRPVLGDVDDLAPSLDAEIARCFGVTESRSLIRQPGGKCARISLRREVGNSPQDRLGYDFAITRSKSQLAASIPASLPLRAQVAKGTGARWGWINLLRSIDVSGSRYRTALPEILADLAVPCAFGTLARPIHYLPADRAGVMHAHRVVVSSLIGRASRAGFGVEPALSGVLADFLEQLISLGDAERREVASKQLAEHLEADILGGTIESRSSAVGYPSFHYRPAQWESELPLMNTSSMVSELAPVVLYLRHVVSPGDVLIIEEPESHLHPAMQVSFTLLLAAVVHSGVRVVVTTHSEWVLEALANTVRRSEVAKPRRKGIPGDELALPPDQVGAWLFERKKRPNGSVVKEIPLDIRSGTFPAGFGEVTEQLYNEWAEIANRVAERGA